MEKKKRILKVLLIILACLLALIIVYEIVIQFDEFLNKNNIMSREEVIGLLEKGKEYPNYYYSSQTKILGNKLNETNITEYYIKDNVKSTVVNGKQVEWTNYNTNENIRILGEHDGKDYLRIGDIQSEINLNSQMGFDYSLITNTEQYNFEYLGEKEENDKTYVIVKVWNKERPKIFSTKFKIDKETGLITERIDYVFYGIILTKTTTDRNVKLDVVKDEDVLKPDMTKYEIYGI